MIEQAAVLGNIVDNAYNPATYGYGQGDFASTMFGGEEGSQPKLFENAKPCPGCSGSGEDGGHTCGQCQGTGVVVEHEGEDKAIGEAVADTATGMSDDEKKLAAVAQLGALQGKLGIQGGLWGLQDKMRGDAPGTYLSHHSKQGRDAGITPGDAYMQPQG